MSSRRASLRSTRNRGITPPPNHDVSQQHDDDDDDDDDEGDLDSTSKTNTSAPISERDKVSTRDRTHSKRLSELASAHEDSDPPGEDTRGGGGGASGERKRHFTRSRIPRQTSLNGSKKSHSQESDSEGESKDALALNISASLLAAVDERSYQRALLRDANSILERIVFPMCFPWQHRIAPVARNIPSDIDDMAAIFTAEEGSHDPFTNGPLGYGRYDNGQSRRGASRAGILSSNNGTRIAARRSHDPGIIELSTLALPTIPPNHEHNDDGDYNKNKIINNHDQSGTDRIEPGSPSYLQQSVSAPVQHKIPRRLTNKNNEWDQDDLEIPGEPSLQCFHIAQRNKQRKIDEAVASTRRKLISIKVDGTSSRASIFDTITSNNHCNKLQQNKPILLAATLPAEVHNGKVLTSNKAKHIVEKLGTYNCRHGSASSSSTSKSSSRVAVGRTRLTWSEKGPTENPYRIYFNSLLTGEKLEMGGQKRPRDVKVGIRLNGSLVSCDNHQLMPQHDSSSGVSSNGKLNNHNDNNSNSIDQPMVSTKIYEKAVDSALQHEGTEEPVKRPQCTFDSTLFVSRILKEAKSSKAKNSKSDQNTMEFVDGNGNEEGDNDDEDDDDDADEEESSAVYYTPPRIDCLPDNNGVMCVICTTPGSLTSTSIHSLLNAAAEAPAVSSATSEGCSPVCSVCWSTNKIQKMNVWTCCQCNLTVHLSCCANQGILQTIKHQNGNGKEIQQSQIIWKCAVCCSMDQPPISTPPISNGSLAESRKRKRETRLPPRLQDPDIHLGGTTAAAALQLQQQQYPDPTQSTETDSMKPRCLYCQHVGGAMSPFHFGGKLCWVHEVCRIWCTPMNRNKQQILVKEKTSSMRDEVCALCGEVNSDLQHSNGLTKCAASHCHIKFHPMCALLATKLSQRKQQLAKPDTKNDNGNAQTDDSDIKDLKQVLRRDSLLCEQYSLSMVQVETVVEAYGKDFGMTKEICLPVSFCGLHNPNRDQSLLSMYPKGAYIDKTIIRIPPETNV